MSMTEQVKRVRAAMIAAGFKKGEFKVRVERIYRGVIAGRKIYEYGDAILYVYTARRFTPAIAKQLVETGEIGAELFLQHCVCDRKDIAPYTVSMRFTTGVHWRGKYRLYVSSKSAALREDILRGASYMNREIKFDEFERLWNNMQHFETIKINEHRFELRFSNTIVENEARTLCEVFPLDWESDELPSDVEASREPIFSVAGFGAKYAKEKAVEQLMSEQVLILADEQSSDDFERVANTLVLYKGARFILTRYQFSTLSRGWQEPVYSLAVVTHLDAAPASHYAHIEERIILDKQQARVVVVDNVAYVAPRGRARNLHPAYQSKRETIRKLANALDSLIEQTLAAHLDSLIEQQREQEKNAFETLAALSRI